MNEITIPVHNVHLTGELTIPKEAIGLVLFVHGSGSSRFSPRNRFVASQLQDGRMGTLLIDLLTAEEEAIDSRTRALRFDIEMLAQRVIAMTEWLTSDLRTADLNLAYFGASTGAAAALIAAAHHPSHVKAVVSRGGRPDLAIGWLPKVQAATLLIVGGHDKPVIQYNQQAFQYLVCQKSFEIVPGAGHLFEERGALERVADLASNWFTAHLSPHVIVAA